jgi:hypothetical protein
VIVTRLFHPGPGQGGYHIFWLLHRPKPDRFNRSRTSSAHRSTSLARRIGVTDSSLYLRLQGRTRPAAPGRITAFLDSLTADRSGVAPTDYQYREYKNWRGIPKPRRCPFCKRAKGEIRKVKGTYQGVCPNCGATGPKRQSNQEALLAWNGKS